MARSPEENREYSRASIEASRRGAVLQAKREGNGRRTLEIALAATPFAQQVYERIGASLVDWLVVGERLIGVDGVSKRYFTRAGQQSVSLAQDDVDGITQISYGQFVRGLGEWGSVVNGKPLSPFFDQEVLVMARAMSLADHRLKQGELWDEFSRLAERRAVLRSSVDYSVFANTAVEHALRALEVEKAQTTLGEDYNVLVETEALGRTALVVGQREGR